MADLPFLSLYIYIKYGDLEGLTFLSQYASIYI